jgi:hypothetical protein
MKGYQARLMKAKDNRVNLTNEVLTGIKLIKLYAWEKDFLARITDLRNIELKELMAYMVSAHCARTAHTVSRTKNVSCLMCATAQRMCCGQSGID